MDSKYFLNKIKTTVKQFDENADIILYGSRARGDNKDYSDWDFLILLDKKPDYEKIQSIRHAMYDIELETVEIINEIIKDRDEWNSSLYRATSFYQNIIKEAIII